MLTRIFLTCFTSLLLAQTQAYDPRDPNASDFILRSGYSRGNDDIPEEKLYETAVLDNELRIKKTGRGWNISVKFVAYMVADLAHARHDADSFAVRSAGVKIWQDHTWADFLREEIRPSVFSYSMPTWTKAGYLLDLKYRNGDRREQPSRIVAAERTIDFGIFQPGTYVGTIYIQSRTSSNPATPYANTRPDDYRVRHIIDWRAQLGEDGLSVDDEPEKLSDGRLHFKNEIRLITPDWHGKKVLYNGRNVVKRHEAPLMWKDVVYLDSRSGNRRFLRKDMLKRQSLHPDNDEVIGRLPKKI